MSLLYCSIARNRTKCTVHWVLGVLKKTLKHVYMSLAWRWACVLRPTRAESPSAI